MIMRLFLRLLLIVGLSGCATLPGSYEPGPAFDDLLAFDDPGRCEEAPQFRDFLRSMGVPSESNSLRLRPGTPEAPPALVAHMSEVTMTVDGQVYEFTINTRGTWKGFPLLSIRHAGPSVGDWGEFSFELDAPIEEVEQRLRADGFPVIAGEAVEMSTDGLSHTMALLPAQGGRGRTIFRCLII